MAVPKQEGLILFDFDDEEDDDINFTENALSEEKSPAFDKDEDKSSSVETDEDMGDEIHSMLDQFGGWWRSQHCTTCTTLYSGCFHGKNMSEETSQEHHIDNSKFKSIQGVVTSLCNDYGWINETIFFNMNLISDNMPLNIGTNVLALVEENPRNHIFKAIKVKAMNNLPEGSEPSKLGRRLCIKCVTSVTEDNIYISKDMFFPLCMFSGGFRPFNGDLLLVEYSMNPGTSNMNIHSASPLNSQNMEEVCVTSIDGRNGMVESTIFFTLDSLHIPSGYIPGLYDIVDIVAVDTMQPRYSWRAVSMTPLQMVN
uniref:cancer/testis antigen 55-like n=1 Tax=Arvicanthis niloticus TaxID=61156 RepID=UPI001486BC4A|nr:cancer/testis antigen 55-like [Arvicanthis niloticus]